MKKQNILSAFRNAFNGLVYFFAHERNGKIQLVAATIAVGFAIYFHVTITEWVAVVLCITSVLCLEMLNSALEKLCDLIQPNYHPIIKIVKDVSAGVVLLASITSIIIACIIFLPKIFSL
jgi:diacylglycerol kinase